MRERVPDGARDNISIQVGGNVVAGHGNIVGHLSETGPGAQSGRAERNAVPMDVAAGRADGAETLVFINYRSSDSPSPAETAANGATQRDHKG